MNIQELKELADRIHKKKSQLERLKRILKEASEKYEAVCQEALQILDNVGMESLKTDSGNLVPYTLANVKIVDKPALVSWLERRGLLDELMSINTRTLGAFYRAEEESEAMTGNLNFSLPGVEVQEIRKLQVRSK